MTIAFERPLKEASSRSIFVHREFNVLSGVVYELLVECEKQSKNFDVVVATLLERISNYFIIATLVNTADENFHKPMAKVYLPCEFVTLSAKPSNMRDTSSLVCSIMSSPICTLPFLLLLPLLLTSLVRTISTWLTKFHLCCRLYQLY